MSLARSAELAGSLQQANTTCLPCNQYSAFDKTASKKAETTLLEKSEDLTRIRARNALKILLDVHENIAVSSPKK